MLFSYGLILLSSILLIAFGDDNPFIYTVSFAIFWFNLGGWLAIAPTSTLKLFGLKNYSQNYGLVFTAYGLGAITGVLKSGLLLDYFGNYYNVFYYVIALCVLGVIITIKYMESSP